NGHGEVVKLLLKTEKVDADVKNGNGITPLHQAASYGHGEVVKLLLKTGKQRA
ncbi:hypothetical protein M422DRAFT_276138, partial [Sphaerobolus stellatus SS14]